MTIGSAAGPRGRWGPVVLATVFALLGINALAQVVLAILGQSHDPGALATLQAVNAIAALAAAWGSLRLKRWAAGAAAAYTVAAVTLLLSLGPILDLGAEEVRGIYFGALILGAGGAWATWYLSRLTRSDPGRR